MANPSAGFCGLYAITPDHLALPLLLELCDAAIAGGAAAIQYRDKNLALPLYQRHAHALLALCRGRNVPLILNDHLEIAVAIGADGVHLGRDDADVGQARQRLGAAAIVGVSCYADVDAAERAHSAGCSYVAFGSLFASPTKPLAPPAALDLFGAARARGVDCALVGIGGINRDNIAALIAAGADAAASIQGVFHPLQRDAVFANARALSLPFAMHS